MIILLYFFKSKFKNRRIVKRENVCEKHSIFYEILAKKHNIFLKCGIFCYDVI